MRRIHSPILLANVEDAKARAFVVLFTCDAFARSILISLVPLQAYELLGAAQLVSVVYFLVGILGLGVNLTVPLSSVPTLIEQSQLVAGSGLGRDDRLQRK